MSSSPTEGHCGLDRRLLGRSRTLRHRDQTGYCPRMFERRVVAPPASAVARRSRHPGGRQRPPYRRGTVDADELDPLAVPSYRRALACLVWWCWELRLCRCRRHLLMLRRQIRCGLLLRRRKLWLLRLGLGGSRSKRLRQRRHRGPRSDNRNPKPRLQPHATRIRHQAGCERHRLPARRPRALILERARSRPLRRSGHPRL